MRLLRRRQPLTAPRPDHAKIAVLEWELFGIQPPPGSTAAALIGMGQLQQVMRQPRFAEQYANPALVGPADWHAAGLSGGARMMLGYPRTLGVTA